MNKITDLPTVLIIIRLIRLLGTRFYVGGDNTTNVHPLTLKKNEFKLIL